MAGPSSETLTLYNFVNILAYVANVLIVYGIGVLGWFGLPNNAELSAKYQTLVTPAGFAFVIWAVIFISQAIFAVSQLFPTFRSKPLVQKGIRFWYGVVCAFQVVWTLAFSFEIIWLSCAAMILILSSLYGLLLNQRLSGGGEGVQDFWILRFPFQLHIGWICAASALNINVVLVAASANASVQVFAAIFSLLLVVGTALTLLFRASKEEELNIVIPLVLAWAIGGIWAELKDPKQSIQDNFERATVNGLTISAGVACIIVVVAACIRTIIYAMRRGERGEDGSGIGGSNIFADPEGSLREPISLT